MSAHHVKASWNGCVIRFLKTYANFCMLYKCTITLHYWTMLEYNVGSEVLIAMSTKIAVI